MLKQIETSILTRLAPVKDLLHPDDETSKIAHKDAGDIVVFIKGGNIQQLQIEVNVLLPSHVRSSTGCFPVVEQVWGLLHLFRPGTPTGVLANMSWDLITQNTRWIAKFNYTAAISPYVFEFPETEDTLPSIDTIALPIVPSTPLY